MDTNGNNLDVITDTKLRQFDASAVIEYSDKIRKTRGDQVAKQVVRRWAALQGMGK